MPTERWDRQYINLVEVDVYLRLNAGSGSDAAAVQEYL